MCSSTFGSKRTSITSRSRRLAASQPRVTTRLTIARRSGDAGRRRDQSEPTARASPGKRTKIASSGVRPRLVAGGGSAVLTPPSVRASLRTIEPSIAHPRPVRSSRRSAPARPAIPFGAVGVMSSRERFNEARDAAAERMADAKAAMVDAREAAAGKVADARAAAAEQIAKVKPRLRGVSHEYAFFVSLVLG